MSSVYLKDNLGSPIDFACRISPSAVFLSGALRHILSGKETIAVDAVIAEKPYIAAILDKASPNTVATIVRTGNWHAINEFNEVSFTHESGIAKWVRSKPLAEELWEFVSYLNSLDDVAASKILFLLMRHAAIQPETSSSNWFIQLCNAARERINASSRAIINSIWMSKNSIYLETILPVKDYSNSRLIINSASGIQVFILDVFPLPTANSSGDTQKYAAVITSSQSLQERFSGGSLSLMLRDQIIPLQQIIPFSDDGVNKLVAYLLKLSDSIKFGLRDFINFTLLKATSSSAQVSDNTKLVRTLQYYLPSKHTSVHDISEPFGINMESVIAIGNKGVFASGWIFDPANMLESLTAVTDTGFSIKLDKAAINRFARSDVEKMYKESDFVKELNNYGFIAFFEYPEDFKKKLSVWPQPFSCRFTATLESGLSYTIAFMQGITSTVQSMTNILDTVALSARKNEAANRHLTSALSTLQNIRIKDARMDKDETFGTAPDKPEVSLIIPLYKSLEYVSAQMAHFACDETTRNAEIIYVLDSPEQYDYLQGQLHKLHMLYKQPVRLITMRKNGGYANSTNTGALNARAEMLVLLNSDVLPASKGWLKAMLEAYLSKQGDVGILAPKLLYEDDSIQHAGMYFHKHDQENIYENRHYYKGYPRNYKNALISRFVPAVTGACMMISKSIFNAVGNLSTDYIVGDFEDSDLCLKVHDKGYKNYYLADVELYHFERQSMSHAKESAEARFWINAAIHNNRWQNIIPKVMQAYEQE